jgi:hypothetical protein
MSRRRTHPTPPNPTRLCGRCHQHLPLADFAWRRKARGQRDNYCRPCRAAYKQEHYAANKQHYIAKALLHKQTLVAERAVHLIEFFRDHPASTAARPTR